MDVCDTKKIASDLESCDSIEEFRWQILPMLYSHRALWTQKLEMILSQTGYSCGQMAKLCRVSEPAVRKWKKGSLPQSRDMYIRIGFAAGYGLEEMNAFLQEYGRCPKLYVKSLEDSVCMFVLQSQILPHTYETYLQLLDMVREELQHEGEDYFQTHPTAYLADYLAQLRSTEEMVAFARQHAPSYRRAYDRLYGYIIDFLNQNLESEHTITGDGRMASLNSLEWSSSLRHCISEIRARRWFPLRHKIISLGLHLNMDTNEINEMLSLAQMKPLYARNSVEAAILWAVEEAKLDTLEDEIIKDGSTELRDRVREKLLQLGLEEEMGYLIEDLK